MSWKFEQLEIVKQRNLAESLMAQQQDAELTDSHSTSQFQNDETAVTALTWVGLTENGEVR